MDDSADNTQPTEAAGTQISTQVYAQPNLLIPKLVTKVGMAKVDQNYIVSFVSELPGEQAQMIERVSLPESIIDDMINLLKELKSK